MSSLISPKLCSSSSSSSTPLLTCKKKPRFSHSLQIRAQIPRDHHEGRYSSNNIVDANLQQLKVRVEEVRNKERLERCCSVAQHGWNYASFEDFQSKRDSTINQEIMVEFLEIVGLVGSTMGVTIFGCSLGLFLISFLLHFLQ